MVLVGFMGAGKSTVGRELAALMGAPFVELDAQIEARAGRSIPEIFAEQGERAFRRLEEAELRMALRAPGASGGPVVAAGGGIVTWPASRASLRAATVVWLDAGFDACWERATRDGGALVRPKLAAGREAARALLRERTALYRAVSGIRVRSDCGSPDAIARRIRAALPRASPA